MTKKRDSNRSAKTAKPSSASALTVMVVEQNVREGNVVRFPSLGITLTKDNLPSPRPADAQRTKATDS